MLRAITETARHELIVTLRTRRALIVVCLYVAAALAAGLSYTVGVRLIEQGKVELERASPGLAGSIDLVAEPAYQRMLAFVAGAEIDEIAPALRGSAIVPFVLWGSLRFLPLLIILTSFDLIAADVSARTLAYSTMRTSRTEIVLGKALGHVTMVLVLSAAWGLAVLSIAAWLLEGVSFFETLPGLLYVLALLVPFGACYLGLTTLCSTLTRQPFVALVASVAIYFGVWIVRAFAVIPETDGWLALLRPLAWISPAMYQGGLWRGDLIAPLTSVGIHLLYAAVMLCTATAVLRRRAL